MHALFCHKFGHKAADVWDFSYTQTTILIDVPCWTIRPLKYIKWWGHLRPEAKLFYQSFAIIVICCSSCRPTIYSNAGT